METIVDDRSQDKSKYTEIIVLRIVCLLTKNELKMRKVAKLWNQHDLNQTLKSLVSNFSSLIVALLMSVFFT